MVPLVCLIERRTNFILFYFFIELIWVQNATSLLINLGLIIQSQTSRDGNGLCKTGDPPPVWLWFCLVWVCRYENLLSRALLNALSIKCSISWICPLFEMVPNSRRETPPQAYLEQLIVSQMKALPFTHIANTRSHCTNKWLINSSSCHTEGAWRKHTL